MPKYPLPRMPEPHLLHRVFVLAVIGVLASSWSMCQVGRIATASMSAAKPPKPEASAREKTSLTPNQCATIGFLPIESSRPATAHHTVTLSWNASALSFDAPAGYCLYKSETEIDIKNPKCSSCEPVNPVPVAKTSCVDDIVKDGVTYYYVVRAVDRSGNPSTWSNVATASVPPSDQVKSSTTAPPALCRVPPAGR